MERDNSKINKKQSNIDHNNTSIYKTKNESDQIRAAKIGAKATIFAAIIGVGGIILGLIWESNRGQNDINETFSEITSNEDGNITLEEVKQDYLSLKRDYEVASDENQKLNSEKEKLTKKLNDANKTIEELQVELSIKDQEIKTLNDKISGMLNVDFQNLNLTINGIESGYNDRTATINNETFYSIGFMKYLVDNQAVSSDGVRLFIGDVQSEEMMPVSLFDLEPFTYHWMSKVSNLEDNYGNIYNEAFKVRAFNHDFDESLNYVQEYNIKQEYIKFVFDLVYPKDADQYYDYEIDIFGDDKLLKTITINRKTEIEHIEINVKNVKFLQISARCKGYNYDSEYFGMINPYLYP